VKSKNTSLDKASRLNLSKPQSIEHNLPVAEIGKVSKEDLKQITQDTLEYLNSGISEAADSPDAGPDDDDDDDDDDEDEEEEDDDDDKEDGDDEEEKKEDSEEDDVVADMPVRRDRNRHRDVQPSKERQSSSWSGGLPQRPQTTIGIRSHGRHGRRPW
jgi:hypothetical protein